MKKHLFYVKNRGMYLIRTPDWDTGMWTADKSKAVAYTDLSFFQKYYPQFEIEILGGVCVEV